MKQFAVSTDSTADLYRDTIEKEGIWHVPLTFMMEKDGIIEEKLDCFSSYEEYTAFYDKLRKGYLSRTAMLNYESHLDHFTKMAKAGVEDAVHFTISSGLSPTVEVAKRAAEEVKKEYPAFRLFAVDSLTATVGQGALVRIALACRDQGMDAESTFEKVLSLRTKIQHFIVADDLNYLMRGGRVSKTSAFVGGALGIKPMLAFDNDGKLFVLEKCRKMKGAFRSILDKLGKIPVDPAYNAIYIVHNDNERDAMELKALIEERFGVSPIVSIMGPVIGSHVGPNAVSCCYLSLKGRNDF